MRRKAWPATVLGVVFMASMLLYPRLLAAQEVDITALVGKEWYGLYLNGQKAGYSMNEVAIAEDGTVVVVDDTRFRISMAGIQQDMEVYSKRTYAAEGDLLSIENRIDDPAGLKEFNAVIQGDKMVLKSNVAGKALEESLPKPKESLLDVLKQAALVDEGAKIGDAITFSVFEPMYKKEIGGTSEIVGVETRTLDGVATKVFRVKSVLTSMGIESDAYVTESGTVLEDTQAGIIKMRLEPEALAKDVNYSNDVIVANAAMVDTPIRDPRTRETLTLKLHGPLTEKHLFNNDRQTIKKTGDTFEFVGRKVNLNDLEVSAIPIDNADVVEWTKPTTFVQSDNPKMIEKAKSIIGDETNALKISNALCDWVNDTMRTTFSAQLTNALEVLENPQGDCTEHSVLFIGLARAVGLPAREVAGLIYMEGDEPGFYFHQWAKVWVGRWIDVDPTFDQPLADVTHIKLAEGDLFEQARLVPIVGRLKVEVVEPGGE